MSTSKRGEFRVRTQKSLSGDAFPRLSSAPSRSTHRLHPISLLELRELRAGSQHVKEWRIKLADSIQRVLRFELPASYVKSGEPSSEPNDELFLVGQWKDSAADAPDIPLDFAFWIGSDPTLPTVVLPSHFKQAELEDDTIEEAGRLIRLVRFTVGRVFLVSAVAEIADRCYARTLEASSSPDVWVASLLALRTAEFRSVD